MTTDPAAEIVPFPGTPGYSGNTGYSCNNADAWLSDAARDLWPDVLEAMQLQAGGITAEATTNTVRVLLLGAAELLHDAPVFGHERALSDMLMQATSEALDAFHSPPPAAA